jgi:hypothetical protein
MRSRTLQLEYLASDHRQAQVRRQPLYALVITIVLHRSVYFHSLPLRFHLQGKLRRSG